MVQTEIGTLLEGEQYRDAIHIAVAPVTATDHLLPGQHIGFVDGSKELVTAYSKKLLGIVDPFLKGRIKPGQRFFMFLYPNTITSLRHSWTHPDFENTQDVQPPVDASTILKSMAWMKAEASTIGIGYHELLEAADRYVEHGDYTTQHGSESWRDNFNNPEEFWPHFEVLTGKKASDHEATFFSCSC